MTSHTLLGVKFQEIFCFSILKLLKIKYGFNFEFLEFQFWVEFQFFFLG